MKSKKDFVTNSSSTSFVVIDKTTGQILREMIKVVWEERGTHKQEEEIMNHLLTHPDFDMNTVLPLTNEETFVYRICPAKVRVDTCFTFHDWKTLPFKTGYCKEFDKVWEKSKKMEFLDMKDFKVKTRDEAEEQRREEILEFIQAGGENES